MIKLQYKKTVWCEIDISMFNENQQKEIIENFKLEKPINEIIDWMKTSEHQLFGMEDINLLPQGSPTRSIMDNNKEIWNNAEIPEDYYSECIMLPHDCLICTNELKMCHKCTKANPKTTKNYFLPISKKQNNE